MIGSMRALVFLLILANLLFFVWTQGYFGSVASPDAIRVQQQLLPDQISIVARGEPPPVAVKAEKPIDNNCLEWAGLTIADADRLERLIAETFATVKVNRSVVPGSSTYWVFIPQSVNKLAADKKAAELKRLGVPEFFVVTDAGPNQLVISLGIFSTEEAANERLEELRVKGVRSAKVGERSVKPALAVIAANGPAAQTELLREAVVVLLPENKPLACKASAK